MEEPLRAVVLQLSWSLPAVMLAVAWPVSQNHGSKIRTYALGIVKKDEVDV